MQERVAYLHRVLCIVALLVAVAGPVSAGGLCGAFYTYGVNDTVTSSNLNANLAQASTGNSTPQCVAGDSLTLGQMQATIDPYPAGVESLPATLEGELQRLRYVVKKLTGWPQWYQHTSPIALPPPLTFTGTANGQTLLTVKRFTDTSPTGTFLSLQNAAGSPLFAVDIAGNLASASVGPHVFGGGTNANVELLVTGTFTGAGTLRVLEVSSALTPAVGQDAYLVNIVGSITQAASGTPADFVGVRIAPPTITGSSGPPVNTSTVKITGAPSGGTNNYALWVASGPALFAGTDSSVAVPAVGLLNNKLVSWKGSSGGYTDSGFLWYDTTNRLVFGANNAAQLYLTSAGILAVGTTVTAGAVAGESVLAYGGYYRMANQTASAATGLIGLVTIGGITNNVNIAPTSALAIGNPTTMSAAAAGDAVLASASALRYVNGGTTERLLSGASGTVFLSPDGRQVRLGDTTAAAGMLHVKPVNASTIGLIVDAAASPSVNLQEWRVNGTTYGVYTTTSVLNQIVLQNLDLGGGGQQGASVIIGRNTNGTNAAGYVGVVTRTGTQYNLWVDASGVLRYGTSTPTNANDTSGNPALAGSFTQEFVSADQTVTFSSTLNVAHGLGAKPKLVQVALKNTTTELGYATGDEVPMNGYGSGGVGSNVVFDTTNVTLLTGTAIRILNKSTFAEANITAANWRYVVRAWR